MKHSALLTIIVSLLATGCGGSSSSATSPSGTTSGTTTFTMQMAASNEVPPIAGAEANVTGTATIALHVTKDSTGNVTGALADFQVTVNGFPAGSQVTMAHIHPGGAGTNGSILVDTGISSSSVTITNGSGSFQKTGVNVPAASAQAMLSSPGAYYFNVHTALNPNGVTRAQMDNGTGGGAPPAVPDPTPVPY